MRGKSINRIRYIAYAAFGTLCAVFLILGFVWAAKGSVSGVITEVIAAEVRTPSAVRTEYIVGEELSEEDYAGVELLVMKKNGQSYTPDLSDCKIECDTSTAGRKPVVVSWQEGTVLYRGAYAVEVFGVRHLEVHNVSQRAKLVYTTQDESLLPEGLEIWASLTGQTQTDAFGSLPTSDLSTVRLSSKQYLLTCSQMGNVGVHDAVVSVGSAKASYQIAITDNAVSENSTLSFVNTSGTSDTLTLHLLTRVGEGGDYYDSSATGYYEMKKEGDGYQVYAFEYTYQARGWHSSTLSAPYVAEDIDNELAVSVWADDSRGLIHFQPSGNWRDVLLYWQEIADTVELKLTDSTKTVFTVGDPFEAEGITLSKIKYKNGKREEISSDYSLRCLAQGEGGVIAVGGTLEKEGVYTVDVQYSDGTYTGENALHAAYDICVLPKRTAGYVPSSSIGNAQVGAENMSADNDAKNPNLDPSLELYVYDDRQEEMTEQGKVMNVGGCFVYRDRQGNAQLYPFTFTFEMFAPWNSYFTAENFGLSVDNLHCGRLDIRIADGRFSIAKGIWHHAVIGSATLSVDAQNARFWYAVGEEFTAAALSVSFVDADGTKRALSESEYTVSAPDMSTVGVKKVKVSYRRNGDENEYSEEYEIFVLPFWDPDKRMSTTNNNGTNEQAEFFIENVGGDSWSWVLYQRNDRCFEMYRMHYQLENGASKFTFYDVNGEKVETLTAQADNSRGGILALDIGGVDFTASYSEWHKKIIGVDW